MGVDRQSGSALASGWQVGPTLTYLVFLCLCGSVSPTARWQVVWQVGPTLKNVFGCGSFFFASYP